MVLVRGADELVVGGVHQIPDPSDLPCHTVYEFLRRYSGCLCLLLDLQAVLVRSRLEADIVALLSFKTCDGVCQHDLIGISDMRLAGGIGNGRGDIIRNPFVLIFSHEKSLLIYRACLVFVLLLQKPFF